MSREKGDDTVTAPLKLVVSRSDADAKILDRIEKGNQLLKIPINSWDQLEAVRRDYYKWSDYNNELLNRLFSNDSMSVEYSGFFGAVVGGSPPSLSDEVHDLHKDLKEKIHRLESIKERLELIVQRW